MRMELIAAPTPTAAEGHRCERMARIPPWWLNRGGQVSTDNTEQAAAGPPDWAAGALLFHDLEQHAARTSRLAVEAPQRCKRYAAAEGLP